MTKAVSHSTPSRRDLLRVTAATATLAVPRTVSAAPLDAAGADADLIEAEATFHRLYAAIHQIRDKMDDSNETDEAVAPLYGEADELEEIIAATLPATIVGVLVKLRRLADPDLGIDSGVTGTGEEGESLRQCVVFLERLGDIKFSGRYEPEADEGAPDTAA